MYTYMQLKMKIKSSFDIQTCVPVCWFQNLATLFVWRVHIMWYIQWHNTKRYDLIGIWVGLHSLHRLFYQYPKIPIYRYMYFVLYNYLLQCTLFYFTRPSFSTDIRLLCHSPTHCFELLMNYLSWFDITNRTPSSVNNAVPCGSYNIILNTVESKSNCD